MKLNKNVLNAVKIIAFGVVPFVVEQSKKALDTAIKVQEEKS